MTANLHRHMNVAFLRLRGRIDAAAKESQRAAILAEYGLLIFFVGIGAIAVMLLLGEAIFGLFSESEEAIRQVNSGAGSTSST